MTDDVIPGVGMDLSRTCSLVVQQVTNTGWKWIPEAPPGLDSIDAEESFRRADYSVIGAGDTTLTIS